MASAKTSTNLSPNIASALCYIPAVGWIIAIVMLVIEKDASVKWNAWQSLLLSIVMIVLDMALTMTLILIALVPLVNIAMLVIGLILAIKAYQGSPMKLPVLAGWVDKIVKK